MSGSSGKTELCSISLSGVTCLVPGSIGLLGGGVIVAGGFSSGYDPRPEMNENNLLIKF